MPNCRGLSGCVAIGDKIYIIGGYRFDKQKCFSNIDVYDTKTDTWEIKKPMPRVADAFEACLINEKIYIIGGYTEDPNPKIVSEVYEYDPAEETWIQKTNMPTASGFMTSSIIDNKIYILGGIGDINLFNVASLSTIEIYDHLNDTWAQQNMPDSSDSHVAAVVNKRIYRIGGYNGAQSLKTVYEYNPFDQPTTSVSPKESLIATWGKIKIGK